MFQTSGGGAEEPVGSDGAVPVPRLSVDRDARKVPRFTHSCGSRTPNFTRVCFVAQDPFVESGHQWGSLTGALSQPPREEIPPQFCAALTQWHHSVDVCFEFTKTCANLRKG